MSPPRKALAPVVEDAPPPKLDGMTVRVETPGLPDLGTLSEQYDHHIVFSRIMRGDAPGHPGRRRHRDRRRHPRARRHPHRHRRPGDGRPVRDGRRATRRPVALTLDRSEVDYRRVAVSNSKVAGQSLGRACACVAGSAPSPPACVAATSTCSPPTTSSCRSATACASWPHARACRTSPSSSATPSAALRPTPSRACRSASRSASCWASWSSRSRAAAQFALGLAGGPLLVGLIVGRAGRTGPLLWSLPHGGRHRRCPSWA